MIKKLHLRPQSSYCEKTGHAIYLQLTDLYEAPFRVIVEHCYYSRTSFYFDRLGRLTTLQDDYVTKLRAFLRKIKMSQKNFAKEIGVTPKRFYTWTSRIEGIPKKYKQIINQKMKEEAPRCPRKN